MRRVARGLTIRVVNAAGRCYNLPILDARVRALTGQKLRTETLGPIIPIDAQSAKELGAWWSGTGRRSIETSPIRRCFMKGNRMAFLGMTDPSEPDGLLADLERATKP
jgi:hypothetical protein